MSTNPPDFEDQWTPSQPPGMSLVGKILLGTALGCAVILLLLCGLVIVLIVTFGAKGTSSDPAVVEEVRSEITSIEIPPSLRPIVSFRARVAGLHDASWVFYADERTRSSLVLNASDRWRLDDPQRAKAAAERSLRGQQLDLGGERLPQRRAGQKVVNVEGKMIPFAVIAGQGVESRTQRIQVLGVFPGREHPTLLLFDGDALAYPEQRIVRMLESIGREPPRRPAK